MTKRILAFFLMVMLCLGLSSSLAEESAPKAALTAPSFTLPERIEINMPLTISWGKVDYADSYGVKVVWNPSGGTVYSYSAEKGTSHTIPAYAFKAHGNYTVTVSATDDDDGFQASSAVQTVKVANMVTVHAPGNAPVGSSVSISWTHNPDHDDYNKKMNLVAPDGSYIYQNHYVGNTGPYVIPAGILRKAGTYTVSMNCPGCNSSYYGSKTFTLTGSDLGDPELNFTAPSRARYGDALNLSWQAVPEAEEYTLTINGQNNRLTETSLLLSPENNRNLYLRLVEGQNTLTIAVTKGRFLVSDTVSIYLTPGEGMVISGVPAVHEQCTPLTFSWTTDPRAAGYYVKLYTPVNSNPFLINCHSSTSYTFDKDEFIYPGDYRIVVQGTYTSTVVSEKSVSFKVEGEEIRVLSYTGYMIRHQDLSIRIKPYPNAVRYSVTFGNHGSTSFDATGENQTLKLPSEGVGVGTHEVTIAALAPTSTGYGALQTKTLKVTVAALPSTVVLNVGDKYRIDWHASASFHVNMFLGYRFRSSNTSVISEGSDPAYVVARRTGTATVTLDNFLGDSCQVKFIVGQKTKSLKITGPETLASGQSATLKAQFSPSNASKKDLQWKIISGSKAAKISSSGKLTAKSVSKPTQVTVRAITQDGTGVYKDFTLTVTPSVTSINIYDEDGVKVTGETITIDMNNGVPLNRDSDLVMKFTTKVKPSAALQDVTWTSSNKKVAKISSSGRLTAVGDGTATITATAKDGSKKKATFKVKVVHLPHSVTITGQSRVTVGQTLELKGKAKPTNATNKKLRWTSSNESIATVDENGVVTALKPGTVKITAQARANSQAKATKTITVLPKATSVSLYNGDLKVNNKTITISLREMDTLTLRVLLKPTDAAQAVTWESDNTKVAKVSADGQITFLKKGTVTITATAKDGSKKKAKVTFQIVR